MFKTLFSMMLCVMMFLSGCYMVSPDQTNRIVTESRGLGENLLRKSADQLQNWNSDLSPKWYEFWKK